MEFEKSKIGSISSPAIHVVPEQTQNIEALRSADKFVSTRWSLLFKAM